MELWSSTCELCLAREVTLLQPVELYMKSA